MPLHVDLFPSRYLAFALVAIYILAIIGLLVTAISPLLSLGLFGLITAHFIYLVHLALKRNQPKSITAFAVIPSESGDWLWQLTTPFTTYEAKLLSPVYVTDYLVVMRFHAVELGQLSILILPDSCERDVFRRLKVLLLHANGLFSIEQNGDKIVNG